jgi:hypothetical protein
MAATLKQDVRALQGALSSIVLGGQIKSLKLEDGGAVELAVHLPDVGSARVSCLFTDVESYPRGPVLVCCDAAPALEPKLSNLEIENKPVGKVLAKVGAPPGRPRARRASAWPAIVHTPLQRHPRPPPAGPGPPPLHRAWLAGMRCLLRLRGCWGAPGPPGRPRPGARLAGGVRRPHMHARLPASCAGLQICDLLDIAYDAGALEMIGVTSSGAGSDVDMASSGDAMDDSDGAGRWAPIPGMPAPPAGRQLAWLAGNYSWLAALQPASRITAAPAAVLLARGSGPAAAPAAAGAGGATPAWPTPLALRFLPLLQRPRNSTTARTRMMTRRNGRCGCPAGR